TLESVRQAFLSTDMTNLTQALGSLWLCGALLVGVVPAGATQANGSKGQKEVAVGALRVFLLDPMQLETIRRGIREGDKTLAAPLSRLERDARKALTDGPFSIVGKPVTPPS